MIVWMNAPEKQWMKLAEMEGLLLVETTLNKGCGIGDAIDGTFVGTQEEVACGGTSSIGTHEQASSGRSTVREMSSDRRGGGRRRRRR